MQTREIVKWLEQKITFILKCHQYINEVNVYNDTVINFGKEYYRIYIEIIAELPQVQKPIPEMSEKEYQIEFFSTIPKYISFTAKHVKEEVVEFHYNWIRESCKVRLPEPPFKMEIKKYQKDTE